MLFGSKLNLGSRKAVGVRDPEMAVAVIGVAALGVIGKGEKSSEMSSGGSPAKKAKM
jgi:hypothetical protein